MTNYSAAPRSSASEDKLVVHDLRKSLGGATVLDGVSFAAEPGRIVGLLGPNGAGKTTTMKAMSGLTILDKGTVRFGGATWESLPTGTGGLCAVFEQSGVSSLAKAGTHLKALARHYGKSAADVTEVAHRVGLSMALKKRVGAFSLGMRRRLSLAEVLLAEPRWVLLDEPMNGLDPQGMMWLRGTLDELRHSGCTIVVSSHLLNEITGLINDVVVMHAGRVLFSGSQPEMLTAVGDWIAPHDFGDPRFEQVCRQAGIEVFASEAGTPIITRDNFDQLRTKLGPGEELPPTHQVQMSLQQAYFLMFETEKTR